MNKKKNKDDLLFSDFGSKESSFFHLLRNTKKWLDLFTFWKLENIIALAVSIIATYLFKQFYCHSVIIFADKAQSLVFTLGTVSIGLLGFIVSGLAITAGTIGVSVAQRIDKDKKAKAIMGILFSFFFVGSILGLLTLVFFLYSIILSEFIPASMLYALVPTFILAYLFSFSILYCIGLLGSCIQMFLVNYKYSQKK